MLTISDGVAEGTREDTSGETLVALLEDSVEITVTTRTADRTGVEMEALTAVAVAGLTVYDMAKAIDKAMEIGEVRLLEKTKS